MTFDESKQVVVASANAQRMVLDGPFEAIEVVCANLRRNLSPLGLQTAAMLLLSYITRQAEAAPDLVHGGLVIDHIAGMAKQSYRKEDD